MAYGLWLMAYGLWLMAYTKILYSQYAISYLQFANFYPPFAICFLLQNTPQIYKVGPEYAPNTNQLRVICASKYASSRLNKNTRQFRIILVRILKMTRKLKLIWFF
jgi:hypothetical protein